MSMLGEATISIAMLSSLPVVQVGAEPETRDCYRTGSPCTKNLRRIRLLLEAGAVADPEEVTRY